MRRVLLLALTLPLAACSLEPKFERPAPGVPESWPRGDAYLARSEAPLPTITYRDIFRDPKLQALIERALANNQDLAIAAGNIAQARAQYRVQRAELFPDIAANAGATFQRSGNGTNIGTGNNVGTNPGTGGTTDPTNPGGGTGTGAGGSGGNGNVVVNNGGGRFNDSYRLTANLASFELDLFGRLRSLNRVALNQYFSTESAARTTRLALIGDLAQAYLTYASDRSLAGIAVETLASAERTVQLTDARLKGGVSPRTDLAQALQIRERAQADLAGLTAAIAQDENLINLLVGQPVAEADLADTLEQVDGLLVELPAGLASDVLLRRPDVIEAEYLLRAANGQIGAARAAFFPRISLTALAGVASGALGSLFTSDAFTSSVAPSVTLPIFDGGALKGNLAYARASRDVALAQYRRAVQSAFREVADALADRGTLDSRLAAEQRIAAATEDTLTLADASYRAGVTPFLNTLDAQRNFYSARRTVVTTRFTRAANLVTLYRVLGGDQLAATVPGPSTGAR